MVKCPYCKESFEEKEIVEIGISKQNVPKKTLGWGYPDWREHKTSIHYFVLSCPRCETIIGFVNNNYQ